MRNADSIAGARSPPTTKASLLANHLFTLREQLDTREPLHIISGYRSAATNDQLRAISKGVASNSLHLQGKAVDIRIPGVPLRALRQAAVTLKRGGVGYYPDSAFLHVDIGRVRYW